MSNVAADLSKGQGIILIVCASFNNITYPKIQSENQRHSKLQGIEEHLFVDASLMKFYPAFVCVYVPFFVPYFSPFQDFQRPK